MDSQRRRNAATDLKATADDIAQDARRVVVIEELKSELHPADPQMADLSEESEQLTEQMAAKAKMETELQRMAERETPH